MVGRSRRDVGESANQEERMESGATAPSNQGKRILLPPRNSASRSAGAGAGAGAVEPNTFDSIIHKDAICCFEPYGAGAVTAGVEQ